MAFNVIVASVFSYIVCVENLTFRKIFEIGASGFVLDQ